MTIHALLALAQSAAADYSEVPIAAAIVDPVTQEIVAQSANRVERDGDPTAHAEMVVIREALQLAQALPPQGGESEQCSQREVPKPSSSHIRDYAKELRKNMTDAEVLLWSALKNSQLQGHRFRKQVPIGPYIVDFACLKQKLIIELDGSQHNEINNKWRDKKRDKELQNQGYRVVRYWNHEVFENVEAVTENILFHLSTPLLASPLRGEKKDARRSEHNKYLQNYDLYVTLEPCAMCAQAISHARIRRLYFGAYDPKSGGVEHGARVFSHPQCHHAPEVIGGIMEQECAALLKNFFADRR